MADVVTLPQLGSTMEEGIVVRWLKKLGENVSAGEPLLEVETDKATMEVEAPFTGTLSQILAQEGELVPVRQAIAVIGDGAVIPLADNVAPATVAVDPISTPRAETVGGNAPTAGSGAPSISPRARRLAAANGVELSHLAGCGSGPYGRVLERDIIAYLANAAPAVLQDDRQPRLTPLAARMANDLGVAHGDLALGLPGSRVRSADVVNVARQQAAATTTPSTTQESDYVVVAIGNLQKRVAENVSRSAFTAPHVTLTLAVDMTECIRLRNLILPAVEQAYGARLSFTDLIVKAAALALMEHQNVNATFNGSEIRMHRKVNIGVAVAVDDGLVVPVLHDANSKPVGALSALLKKLVARAKENRLTPDELSGGTFTITNLGSFDIDHFNPVIVTGQAAILGVCRIAELPVVVNGVVEVRSMMNLCLSFDHRVTNGAPAAKFLQTIKQLLEAPARLIV